jgi:hypothetical protein
MSLSAREQQALDSIKERLADSDPDLAAQLAEFARLAEGEDLPDREKIRTSSRQAHRRLRHAGRRFSWRRGWRRMGLRRAAVLLSLLATGVLIATLLALNASGNHGACTEPAAPVCTHPAPVHSSGPASHDTTIDQAPQQQTARITQAGP